MTDDSPDPVDIRPVTLRLPAELHEHYRVQAFTLRTTMSALMIAALYTDAQMVRAGA